MRANAWDSISSVTSTSISIFSGQEFIERANTQGFIEDFTHIFIDESDHDTNQNCFHQLQTCQSAISAKLFYLRQESGVAARHLAPNLKQDVFEFFKPLKISSMIKAINNQLPDPGKPVTASNERPLKGFTLLVAEDNRVNQQVAKEILSRAGADVTIAKNGQLAVDICRQQSFDLVLMDVQMPVMDGYTATKHIRQHFSASELPVIALTANAMKSDRDKCLAHDMNDYLSKPIDRKILFETLLKYLKPETRKKHTPDKPSDITSIQKTSILSESDFKMQDLVDLVDSQELACELVNIFIDMHELDASKTRQLVAEQEFDTAYKLVHKLKGSSGELRLNKLHQLCIELGKDLKIGQQPDGKTLEAFEQQLFTDISYLKETLKAPQYS